MGLAQSLKNLIVDHIKSKEDYEATLAAETAFELKNIYYKGFFDKKEILFWSNISDDIIKECYQQNRYIFEDDFRLSVLFYSVLFDKNIEIIIKMHGFKVILYNFTTFMNQDIVHTGLAPYLLNSIFPDKNYVGKRKNESYIKETVDETSISLKTVGEYFLECSLPIKPDKIYFSRTRDYNIFVDRIIHNRKSISILCNYLDPNAIFGAFCLLAIAFELNPYPQKSIESMRQFIEKTDISPLKEIFLFWLEYADYIEVKNKIDNIGFTNRQKEFILNWAQKNVSFLISCQS